jgi:F0F1-type ATP synthase membrane subunit c/vacuolar-type H+-ATPase subunit K
MSEQNQHGYSATSARSAETLQEISDIKRIMERSSRFISLSGLSGIAAGICALIGAFFADRILKDYYAEYNRQGSADDHFAMLKIKLVIVAATVLLAALILAFIFTWRRARQNHLPVWDLTARKLLWNVLFPLIAGGLFVLAMLQYNEWHFVAPASLVFYGLALVNGSKYTLSDVRYLGYSEIVLGLISTQFIHSGLYFWAIGFGVLHIIYGTIMWLRYERVNSQ